MEGQKSYFIQRILRLLRLLKERHLDPDQISDDISFLSPSSPEERQDLQAALDSIRFMDEIPGGFFIYYAQDGEELIHANQGVLRMFQCQTLREFRELTGNSFRGMVHPDDLEEVEESIRQQIHESQHDTDYVEYRIRRKDGSSHWVVDYGHFARNGDAGDIFYVFLGDPTEERASQQTRQNQALADALEKANLAVKAKNAFLSQMSHEMRTPLNAIFGFTTLAKTSLRDTKTAREYLEQVETASRQLLSMIDQALNASNLSSSTDPSREECDLCDTLGEVYDFLQPQAQEKSIRFSLDCGGVKHRVVYTDPKWLRQLVLNLANNALTYTNAGGSVDIVLTEEKPLPDSFALYRLEVRDTGAGIGKEFLDRVFEPFSREKSSTLTGIRGIGLGLTIAKNIVDLMDGTISVQSEEGKGSTFSVLLPFWVMPESGSGDTQAANPSLRILLAEDNEINREIETELLQRMGFTVISVSDGREALDKLEHAQPGDYDLVIMDLQMPVMDGWQVAAAIRALPDPALAHTPIIALSANVGLHDRRKSMESGIDVHLSKPMDLNVLLETIEKIVRKRSK